MAHMPHGKRTDQASRIIQAPPEAIFCALTDPKALMSWLPPEGMEGRILAFEPRAGGAYHMILTYKGGAQNVSGKSSEHADVVRGRFLEVSENDRVVQQIEFESEDPAFAGAMTMTWLLTAVGGGTEVSIVCTDVPEGIRKEDHDIGMRSSLANLAAFTEP